MQSDKAGFKANTTPVTLTQQTWLREGALALVTTLDPVHTTGPVGQNIGPLPVNLGEVNAFHTGLQQIISIMNNYFDTSALPTVEGLILSMSDLDIVKQNASAITDTEIDFNFKYHVDQDLLEVPLELGTSENKLGLSFDAASTIGVNGSVDFDLTFGIDKTKADLADAFFVRVNDLTLGAKVDAADLDMGVNIGFLGANIVDGWIKLNAALKIGFNDPTPGATRAEDKITFADLDYIKNHLGELLSFTPTTSLDSDLPVTANIAGLEFPLGGTPAGIKITSSDLLGGNISFDSYGLDNLLGFKNMNAASFVAMLAKVTEWMQSLKNSSMGAYDIPFVGDALKGVLGFGDMVRDTYLYDSGADGEVDGDNALLADLNGALADARLSSRIVAKAVDSKITLISIDPNIKGFVIAPKSNATGETNGFDGLGFGSGPVFSTGTRAAITAADAATFKLAGDAVFTVSITTALGDENPVTVTLSKEDTDLNTRVGDDEPKLVQSDNSPNFSTAQQLVDRLNLILGLNSYNIPFDSAAITPDDGKAETPDDNVITFTVPHKLATGQSIVYTTAGTAIGGLTSGTTYYVIKVDDNKIRLAANPMNADKGTAIALTNAGAGNHAFKWDLISFDPAASVLKFNLGSLLKYQFPTLELPLDFDFAPLDPLLNITSDSQVNLDAAIGLDPGFSLGLYLGDLVPGAHANLNKATKLSALGIDPAALKIKPSAMATSAVTPIYGRLSGDAIFKLTVDGIEHTVTVYKTDTNANRTVTELAEDINTALGIAGVSGIAAEGVETEVNGNPRHRVQLKKTSASSVAAFSISAASESLAIRELGFQDGQAAEKDEAGNLLPIVGTKDVPVITGLLDSDVTITFTRGTSTAVTVKSANTQTNRYILDLVADINNVLKANSLDTTYEASSQGNRIVFTAKDDVNFSVSAEALGFSGTVQAARDNFIIYVKEPDGTAQKSYRINLEGIASKVDPDVEEIMRIINNQTGGNYDSSVPGKVTLEVNLSGTGLNLIDHSTSGTGLFQVKPLNGSNAASLFGILGIDSIVEDQRDNKIEGSQIYGVKLTDRFFMENASLFGDVSVTTPEQQNPDGTDPDGDGDSNDGINASAKFGFVEINAHGGGSVNAHLKAGLKDPGTSAADGRISLTEILDNVSNFSSLLILISTGVPALRSRLPLSLRSTISSTTTMLL